MSQDLSASAAKPGGLPVPGPPTTVPLDAVRGEQVMRKVTLRLLPFLFVLYVLNILDRVNLSFAGLTMHKQVGINEREFGRAAGLFFIGYFLFEIPSNLLLERFGARRWIARIMVSWGLLSAGMMFVNGPWSLYLLRFLLGLAEAGFFPGVIFYLSGWFPARERARAVSRFMLGSALNGLICGPLSGVILQYTDGMAGLAGWQWLFLLEGIPSVLMGLVVLRYLTDRPGQAAWLTPPERAWLTQRLQGEEQYRVQRHGLTLGRALCDPRVWLLCSLYYTASMGCNSFGAYLPKILDETLPGLAPSQIGFLGALPNLVAAICMILVGTHSDATGERRWHVALPALVAAYGWALVAWAPEPWVAVLGLCLAQAGMLSMLGPFWSLPTAFLSGTAAAGGIALIDSVGNLGGFVGPSALGEIKQVTGSYGGGGLMLSVTLAIGAVLALLAKHEPTPEKELLV